MAATETGVLIAGMGPVGAALAALLARQGVSVIACERETEQVVHRCGTRTVEAGGWPWLTNDRVNLLCSLVGAAVALALR